MATAKPKPMKPKSRERKGTRHHEKQQIEPTRISVFDTLKENFRIAERVTYVHRMIYIGEQLNEDKPQKIQNALQKIVDTINDRYCDEKLTGMLWYHTRFFCHFIEGSEETLFKHLRLLLMNETSKLELGRMKLLIVQHHINQRILDEWMGVTAKPPTLLEKLPEQATLQQVMEKVKYCIGKLYGLGLTLQPVEIEIEDENAERYEFEMQRKAGSQTTETRKTNMYGQIVNPIYQFVPEISILELLLSSQYTQDLRSYMHLYGDIPYLDAYEDLVWPVPREFVPMFIYEKEINPVTDLPTVPGQIM